MAKTDTAGTSSFRPDPREPTAPEGERPHAHGFGPLWGPILQAISDALGAAVDDGRFSDRCESAVERLEDRIEAALRSPATEPESPAPGLGAPGGAAGDLDQRERVARLLHVFECEDGAPEGETEAEWRQWWDEDGCNRPHYRRRAERMLAALRLRSPAVQPDWTPTPANINALPEPIRRYVHDLATRCDPAGDVRELAVARDTIRALEAAVQPETGWETIESAPKDGTPVLVARHAGDSWGWVTGHGQWESVAGIGGWVSHGFHRIPGELGLGAPTHWRPLPAPPAAEPGGDE